MVRKYFVEKSKTNLLQYFFLRTFPWGCVGGLLKRLVPDAAPHAHVTRLPQKSDVSHSKSNPIDEITSSISMKHSDMMNDASLSKTPSLLIKRTPSLGERVL